MADVILEAKGDRLARLHRLGNLTHVLGELIDDFLIEPRSAIRSNIEQADTVRFVHQVPDEHRRVIPKSLEHLSQIFLPLGPVLFSKHGVAGAGRMPLPENC